jgi:hypothetical protein
MANKNKNGSYIGTFILDFQTVNFESDSKIAIEILSDYHKLCNFSNDCNTFALDNPVSSAGWAFAKLFLSGQFVEKLCEINSEEIDGSRGKKFEAKFVSWLSTKLRNSKCEAQIKIAMEMK